MSAHKLMADLSGGIFPATGKVLHVGPSGGPALFGWGPTVPSGVAGWSRGAIFIDSDSGVVYSNTGTTTSCAFSSFGGEGPVVLGETAHDGLLIGSGTSGTPYTMSGDSKSALSFYATSASTADSNRCAYMRLYLTGAAGGGEAIRAFATGSGVGLTALCGAHVSASISGSGTVTGEMHAIKGTLHVPNSTLGGTTAALVANIYADGTSAAASNGSYLRFINDGAAATGLDTVPLMNLDGFTIATGNTVEAVAGKTLTTTHFIMVDVAGVGNRYFPIGTIA